MKQLKDKCTEISSVFETGDWEYDSRFEAAALVFKSEHAEKYTEKLSSIFGDVFDHVSIKKAPKDIKLMSKIFHGVNKGQQLFISVFDDVIIFGAWWPWGNGESITIRIGFYGDEDSLSDEEARDIIVSVFSVTL